MLFHVTITHSQEDCPGRRPGEIPELTGPAERLEALGKELSVTAHSVVWGASCILWAEPQHVAYALLEAASLDAIERYIDALTPAGWAKQALPVFMVPNQLVAVREILATPAIPVVEAPAAVVAPVDDRDTADTLEGLTVEPAPMVEPVALVEPAPMIEPVALVEPPTMVEPAPMIEPVALVEPATMIEPATLVEPAAKREPVPTVELAPPSIEPPEEPLDKRATRAIPQPVAPLDPAATRAIPQPIATPPPEAAPDSGAVTRFIDRRTVLESLGSLSPSGEADGQPESDAADHAPYAPSESSTVILEPKVQRATGMRLIANTGPAQGSIFDVGEDGATLGRLPENSISLTDGRLSRHHARIDFRDDGYWLSDLGSQNGTLVNDHPLTESHRLQPGDSIELGTTRLTVMLDATT